MMARTGLALAMTALGLAAAPAAWAHSPYLAPTTFAPDRDYVSVQSAMTEGNFFVPDFPIRAAGDYQATGPDGKIVAIGAGTQFREFGVVEVPLPTEGTWKVGTGERPGRSIRWARVDGQWRPVRPASAVPARPAPGPGATAQRPAMDTEPGRASPIDATAVPANAETVQVQAFIEAETYVSRGAPTPGALKPTGQGFELAPTTHPNEIYAGEPFRFAVLNDGKPAADVEFTILRAGDAYAAKKYSFTGRSDATGAGSATFEEPGVYVLEVHYSDAHGPSGAPAAKLVVYTLTFEVTR